ncbi:hypothetical protein NECAME_18191, partial [Necator americanus]
PYDEDIKPFKRRQGERAPRPTPCGPNCHLLETAAEQSTSNGTIERTRSAASKTPTSPRNRKNQGSGGTPLIPPNGQIGNGRVAPFSNPTLMNILVSLLAGEKTSICLITAQMKMICEDIGAQPRTCSEIYRLASQLAQANPSLTPEQKKVSIKDKHRSFRSFTWADGKGQVENKERMVPCSHSVSSADAHKTVECGFQDVVAHQGTVEQSSASAILRDGNATRICVNRANVVGISGIAGWGCFIQETADK